MKRTTKTIMAIIISLLTVLGTTVVFAEDPIDISETAEIALAEENELVYNGTVQKPSIIIKNNDIVLTPDMDYAVEYPESVDVGKYTLTVNYKGAYTGSSTFDYNITPFNAVNDSNLKVLLSSTSYVYDGKSKSPNVTVSYGDTILIKDKDYTVSYSNNINAGTATAKVKMIGNYTGNISKNFSIKKKDAGKFKVTLSATSYTYNGKVKTPSVTVKDNNGKTLKKNTDYTVSYAKGRKNVGKYAVKITFKKNYSGTKTINFTIQPKATSLKSVTATMQGFKVSWKKQATQTTGYQIQYSTSSKFKSPKYYTTKNSKTLSKTFSKMGNKKTYYVRIRTYKKVGDTKIYSAWSKAKKVTCKGVNNISGIKTNPELDYWVDKDLAVYYGNIDKFKINWKKTTNVTGYQIKYEINFYDNNDNLTKKTNEIKLNQSKTTYTVKKLKGYSSATIKIRTYKTVKENNKNKTYYGDYIEIDLRDGM